jgi:hypothetical protein
MSKYAIQVTLFDGGHPVQVEEFRTKTAAQGFVSSNLGVNRQRLGRCRIWYNAEQDFWNEFESTSLKEFQEKLDADTERELLNDLAA